MSYFLCLLFMVTWCGGNFWQKSDKLLQFSLATSCTLPDPRAPGPHPANSVGRAEVCPPEEWVREKWHSKLVSPTSTPSALDPWRSFLPEQPGLESGWPMFTSGLRICLAKQNSTLPEPLIIHAQSQPPSGLLGQLRDIPRTTASGYFTVTQAYLFLQVLLWLLSLDQIL